MIITTIIIIRVTIMKIWTLKQGWKITGQSLQKKFSDLTYSNSRKGHGHGLEITDIVSLNKSINKMINLAVYSSILFQRKKKPVTLEIFPSFLLHILFRAAASFLEKSDPIISAPIKFSNIKKQIHCAYFHPCGVKDQVMNIRKMNCHQIYQLY